MDAGGHHRKVGIGLAVAAAALCLAAPAAAGPRVFTGELAANGADVKIDAVLKHHRIRRITDFDVTDAEVGGIPVYCTGSDAPGDTYLGYPGTYDAWRVDRDRRFSVAGQEQTDFVGLEIQGRFSKDRRSAGGTVAYDGPAFEEPWYCHTDGRLAWTVSAVSAPGR